MASATKTNDGKNAMAGDQPPDERDEASKQQRPKPKPGKPLDYGHASRAGYFTVYKSGQGYWTRAGTVMGVILIGVFTAWNLQQYVPTFLPASVPSATGNKIGWGVAIGFCVGFAWLCWHLLNKPLNVDFLIATDSEMKKVNWTSRKELIGSTKVVIAFMFLTALFLFVCDVIFIFIFKALTVLKFGYFG